MNRLIWLLSLLCICFVFTSCEKDEDAVTGCIDNMALNYNSNATEDDGSCDYDCPNNGTEDLFERTWAVIYAEYEEGGWGVHGIAIKIWRLTDVKHMIMILIV